MSGVQCGCDVCRAGYENVTTCIIINKTEILHVQCSTNEAIIRWLPKHCNKLLQTLLIYKQIYN